MRITNKMITSKYTRSLNNLSVELNKLNTQVSSGRAFSKSSENTSAAIKAYQIRRDLSKVEGYQSNIAHAKASLTNAESAMSHIEELVQRASEQILAGLNGTQSKDERKIIATELRNLQDQLFQTLNSSVSNKYYFGGSNTDTRPFELVGGKLQYNGYDMDLPLPAGTAAENQAVFEALKNDSLYLDIGLNVKYDGVTGEIDNSTVFGYSVAGINVVGSGTSTVEGIAGDVSNNLYNLLDRLAAEFESTAYSGFEANALFGHFSNSSIRVIKSITEMGSKASYLDFMAGRLDTQYLNMQERQLSIEGADPVGTIIKYRSQEVAYNAALQMGTRIIQSSIFDFMS